jgi:hypothetical protein
LRNIPSRFEKPPGIEGNIDRYRRLLKTELTDPGAPLSKGDLAKSSDIERFRNFHIPNDVAGTTIQHTSLRRPLRPHYTALRVPPILRTAVGSRTPAGQRSASMGRGFEALMTLTLSAWLPPRQ